MWLASLGRLNQTRLLRCRVSGHSQVMKTFFHSLFQQATASNVNTDQPGLLDLKGKAKWDSWNKLKGMSKKVY